jgi:iron complex transport system ATP-binding protein
VLAVFHDLNLASAYCDELVVLSEGRIVARGTPNQVLDASLLRWVYGLDASVVAHPVSGRPVVLPPGWPSPPPIAAPEVHDGAIA